MGMATSKHLTWKLVPLLGVAFLAFSCATFEGLRAIPDLEIELDRIADVHLAGVSVDRARTHRNLSAGDALRIADALRRGVVPLDMVVVLSVHNPSTSAARIELLTFDWTLFLDRRETVSGVYTHGESIAPGRIDDVGIDIELDLARYFDDDASALFDLAARAAGVGGREPEVGLRLRPTIETPVGTIRYPRDIVVGSGVETR
jgi:hypothetical protein